LSGQNENLNSSNSIQIDGNNNKKLPNSPEDIAAALIQKEHSRAESAGFLSIFSELKNYEEELRANKIENLDSILSETKNRFSTSSDKDGYWYFKRKEGCKYLPQNGPIFKNEVHEETTFISKQPLASHQQLSSLLTSSNNSEQPSEQNQQQQLPPPPPPPPPATLNRKTKKTSRKDRLRELQQFYYGYAITKHNRHLGLVRRRLGRNGRIVMDKFGDSLNDCINDSDLARGSKNNSDHLLTFDFNKFKNYYPPECFDLNDSKKTKEPPTTIEPNPKKKLKLKKFDDSKSGIIINEDDIDETEPLYDHNLFSYQFSHDVDISTNCQFIDKATETQLTVLDTNPDVLEENFILKNNNINNNNNNNNNNKPTKMPTSFTASNTNFDPINYDYDLLNTDLDFDNLFEPDMTDSAVLIDSNNLIKLEMAANLNEAYLTKSNEQLLDINTIKIALKNLKIPVKETCGENQADEQEKIRAHDPGGELKDGGSNCQVNGLKTENKMLRSTNLIPVCNITSATLTPPSPSSTLNEIKVKKEETATTTTTTSTIPQALNKFTILSNSQPSQTGSRFNSLNKVGLKQSCTSNQFQFRSHSPSSKPNEPLTNGTSFLTSASTFLVKKQVKTEGTTTDPTATTNAINNTSNITNGPNQFYATSSSSSPSSSGSNTQNSQSAIIQPSSVIVNGLLSKNKDENNPFYSIYHSTQNNSNNSQEPTQIASNSKLLQAIHFNQSNLVASTSTQPSSATSSSIPSSSHSQFPTINGHICHQKSPVSNGANSAQNESNSTTKLM